VVVAWRVRLTQPTLTGSNLKQPSFDLTLVVCIPYRCLDCQAAGTVKEGSLVQFVVSFLAEMNIVTEMVRGLVEATVAWSLSRRF